MVIGVYGLLYCDVARAPEQGRRIAEAGLLGKLLGPMGLAGLIITGRSPARTMILCLTAGTTRTSSRLPATPITSKRKTASGS
jgi:hypothetical protein